MPSGSAARAFVLRHTKLQAVPGLAPIRLHLGDDVLALWRATQWIKGHSPEEIYDAIEPYVGSTSRDANVFDIGIMKKVTDYECVIDAESFARGQKVWFREMTGIKPLAMADVVTTSFIEAARKAYPA